MSLALLHNIDCAGRNFCRSFQLKVHLYLLKPSCEFRILKRLLTRHLKKKYILS